MAEEKAESRNWLDDLALVTAQQDKTPGTSQGELSRTLKLHRPYVTNLLALQPIFDPPTVAKVRQAAPDYNLPFSGAKELLALKDKVEDFPKACRKALDEILAKRLSANQIKDLVKRIVSDRTPGGKTLGRRIGDFIANFIDSISGAQEDVPAETVKPTQSTHSTGSAVSTTETAQPSQGSRL